MSAPTAPVDQARPTAAMRVLAVLSAFGPRHRTLSLSEIARRAGLTLPTAHRLIRELVDWGGLERDADGRYSVGLRLLELAALAPRGLQLREAAFPYLDNLHEATRGNVHLGVRDGLEVVYVEALRARKAVSSRVGDRWPMHATGTGLVLLAHADRDLQAKVLSSPLERFTPLTVTDPAELRRHLARIRQTGVAVARGQITVDDMVVAVPVLGVDGQVAAAISVVVETVRARPRALARILLETSRSLSKTLAGRGLPPGESWFSTSGHPRPHPAR
ncbi:IclR family transcriptional regulator [Amycolatopsis sp. GM8]|uniref:IclR family transcriptional regulator n=1 Tax=Amycolatopsis sp. GM8 TaxID=2896530 RepID=UPI001F4875B5|nr:IclR family transcriptional regulator [Amycolatopsis sp. GM8]